MAIAMHGYGTGGLTMPKSLPDTFWKEQSDKLRAPLKDALQRVALIGVDTSGDDFEGYGISFDADMANERAAEWAESYTDELLQQLGSTTEDGVGQAISDWLREPGATSGDLDAALASLLDDNIARANAIAVTETTRAVSQGDMAAYEEAGIALPPLWNDPIAGEVRFAPPLHVNCRCDTATVFVDGEWLLVWSTLRDPEVCPNPKVKNPPEYDTPVGVVNGCQELDGMCISDGEHLGEMLKSVGGRLTLVKGDVDGHPFRGNQWTQGIDETVAPDRSLTSDADYVYHATNEDNAVGIAESGKLATHTASFGSEQSSWPDGSRDKRSYWSAKAHVVADFAPAEGKPVVLRARRDASEFKREAGTGDIYSRKPVNAKDIEILTTSGWKSMRSKVAKGDVEGHEFRGNQYTSGKSYSDSHAEWVSGLKDDEVDAIYTWVNGHWANTGGSYHGLKSGSDTKMRATLDAALDKAPDFEGRVYRGMEFNSRAELNSFINNVKARSSMGDNLYSTSTDKSVASEFAQVSPGKHPLLIEMNVKHGKNIDGVFGDAVESEREVLMRGSSKFKYDHSTYGKDGIVRLWVNEVVDSKVAKGQYIDAAAHSASTGMLNTRSLPSRAQTSAGNYPKGHIKVNGLNITIENPVGSKRKPEYPVLASHYGYIRGSIGNDGDHVDCFVKVGTQDDYSGPVYVINQQDDNGVFDEHKVMIGWDSKEAAVKGYMENYNVGWNGLQSVFPMTMGAFKQWLRDGNKREAVVAKAVVAMGLYKHLPGQHDQSDHAGGHSADEKIPKGHAAAHELLADMKSAGLEPLYSTNWGKKKTQFRLQMTYADEDTAVKAYKHLEAKGYDIGDGKPMAVSSGYKQPHKYAVFVNNETYKPRGIRSDNEILRYGLGSNSSLGKHLPGRHNQSEHGRAGGGSEARPRRTGSAFNTSGDRKANAQRIHKLVSDAVKDSLVGHIVKRVEVVTATEMRRRAKEYGITGRVMGYQYKDSIVMNEDLTPKEAKSVALHEVAHATVRAYPSMYNKFMGRLFKEAPEELARMRKVQAALDYSKDEIDEEVFADLHAVTTTAAGQRMFPKAASMLHGDD